MKPPLLSILTPACWERVTQLKRLRDKISHQLPLHLPWAVEHVVMLDNRTRSVGLKRQALLDAALGQYIAFVDDDDDVSLDYVNRLVNAIQQHPEAHVITFEQRATYNGKPFKVTFQHGASDQHLQLDGPDDQELIRGPWHVCAWRRDRIAHCQFLDTNYGEDAAWVKQARMHVTQAHHIPQVLHFYHHDARTTLAPELTSPS